MPPRLIFNADDFGRSTEINRAVIRAHREGVLNSASLMVAGQAAEEAIALAKEHPGLAVGLHLVLVDGQAVLSPARIPHLLDSDGRFPNQPVRLGLRYAFSKVARREMNLEMIAQFERFAASRLPLAHVDSHQHMHMHPAVFDLMLPEARRFGARRVRIVRDDLPLALQYRRWGAPGKILSAAIFAALARRCTRAIRFPQPATYGFFQSGHMTERYVLMVLQRLQNSAELYFHPTDGPRLDNLGPNPDDLNTLLSGAVRAEIKARGLLLGSAAELAESGDFIYAPFISEAGSRLPAT